MNDIVTITNIAFIVMLLLLPPYLAVGAFIALGVLWFVRSDEQKGL